MKYILLLLLFPLCAVSEEEIQVTASEIDRIPVHIYRGGFYDSTAVLCRYPSPYISRFDSCSYYPHWGYQLNFSRRPVDRELSRKASELERKRDHYYFESLSGDANAQYFLGSYYAYGIRMPMDLSKAYAWFRISADNGNIVSQRKLEDMIERAPQEVIEEGENLVPLLYDRIAAFIEDMKEEPEIEDTVLVDQEDALSY